VLILGSLPGERSLAERRYYAHPQNQFWRLVGTAIGCELAPLAYEDRLAVLRDRGVGLWDVVARARREGSSDAAIRDAEHNDLAALVDTLPCLRAVGFNGATSVKIGRPLLAERGLALIALPSSSPLHTVGVEAKHPAWDALRLYLA
jgi:hypoxanthine-DNA glycosylase